ncbi:DUF6695 family protein [Saccharicrinis fermentans]|uniref:DUF6695 domain-containing protein n=1 Tax=Saccharicrinis fermentans DSM 9555 = JCM 21142 TaxID=869213 RepID=W7Y6N5_9BACT|nr:hypothetical protein [Saccharicrinis fermentans]GAF03308.1 hypothetical protein JCM21142_41976 [Saccharicrinis fermentans DSM 9555 = JCM 21142]
MLRAGKPNWRQRFRLKFWLTPTPLTNVHAFYNQTIIKNISGKQPAYPSFKPHKKFLQSTLPQPPKHPNIPEDAQWLAGEGAGSWFHVETEKALLKITRYSPSATIECTGFYDSKKVYSHWVDLHACTVTYPSHCHRVTIKL